MPFMHSIWFNYLCPVKPISFSFCICGPRPHSLWVLQLISVPCVRLRTTSFPLLHSALCRMLPLPHFTLIAASEVGISQMSLLRFRGGEFGHVHLPLRLAGPEFSPIPVLFWSFMKSFLWQQLISLSRITEVNSEMLSSLDVCNRDLGVIQLGWLGGSLCGLVGFLCL